MKFAEYTEKKKPVIFLYTLHDTTLRTTEKRYYLGVTISSNLNWSSHINTITNKAKNSLRFIRRNVKTQQTPKRGCIQNICTPPGRILFNHMAHMAETPHTQTRNGSKVSRKLCSKWLSLHKKCHKHAQRVKVVYSWATQKSSLGSHNITQNT